MDVSSSILHEIEPIERETIRRVAWRLMPLLMLGYFCAYLDRSNVGMAGPTMTPDLGFSNAVFGFGAGLFFLGYFLAEIPSNLFLNKVGARIWFARILITWGIVSGLTAFVWSDWSFYCNRILLGLAEAGFYPGVVLYLTWWFPSYYRSRMMAMFQSASVISLFVGPPIGGLLLYMDGLLGFHGWQWLFIIEALPPIIMCFVMFFLLTDRPADATWLRPDQRAWLNERLSSERAQREAIRKYSLGEAFGNPKVWLLTLSWFGLNVAGYGLIFFLPLIVKGLGVPAGFVGLASALPYLCAFVAMNLWGWHSDKTGERSWHAAGACLLCATGLAACTLIGLGHPAVTMFALCLAAMGSQCVAAAFWALPSAMLTGVAAAGAIALINSIGNLGGWLGPTVYGLVKDATGSTSFGLLCLAGAPVISAIVLVLVGHDRRTERMLVRK
ncbi:MAG: MFS transporter [Rhodopila sp.]|nr:MFS transporter [Rhodopila sp.]